MNAKFVLIAAALSATAAATAADIYTWSDATGVVHYGDQPPQDVPSQRLDPAAAALSTIGASALRSAEIAMLETLRQQAERREEKQQQLRALAAATRPAPVAPVVIEARPSVVHYPLRRGPVHHRGRGWHGDGLGWRFSFRGDRWRFASGGGDLAPHRPEPAVALTPPLRRTSVRAVGAPNRSIRGRRKP